MQRQGGTGRPFVKGNSWGGHSPGRPKGAKSRSTTVRELFAQAANDPKTFPLALAKLKELMTEGKTLLQAMELRAKLEHEIGQASDVAPTVIITVRTNVDPTKLRRKPPK